MTKQKAGGPYYMDGGRYPKMITFSDTADTGRRLTRLAKLRKISRSELIREILAENGPGSLAEAEKQWTERRNAQEQTQEHGAA